MEKYDNIEQYIRSQEPESKERAELWQTAIGLQKVDGLTVSDFLIETAKQHIEKSVDIAQVKQLITGYYKNVSTREKLADNEEADKSSANIVQLLSEPSFSFSVEGLAGIHRRVFNGVFEHAGKFREFDITKAEWVLDGASVIYGPCTELRATIQYDIDKEKSHNYSGQTSEVTIAHFAKFIANLWQIHPFREGNTITIAVFAIKYLRMLGFEVENDMFKNHSWYFRNALVRANYRNVPKGIEPTHKYLELFFRNLLLGEQNELKNRFLHIRAQSALSSQENPKSSQESSGSSQESSQENLSSRDKVIAMLRQSGDITLREVADQLGISRRAVQKITAKLKAEGILTRIGSTKAGKWVIKS